MEEYQPVTPPPVGTPVSMPEPPAPIGKRPKNKKLIIGAVVAVILIIAAGAGTLLYTQGKKPVTPASTTTAAPMITYYYNDGTTVMLQDKSPEKADTFTQAPVAPHFLSQVRHELEQEYGEDFYKQGAWDVVTTLDKNLQASAEKYITAQEPSLVKASSDAAGFIGEDVVTGKIVSWVGGFPDKKGAPTDYANKSIEPGSSIKPFVYATLFDKTTTMGAGSKVEDTQGPLDGYPCTVTTPISSSNCLRNYDLRYLGSMPIRYALGTNRNVPAVHAANTVGIKTVQDTVKKLGAVKGYSCFQPDSKLTKPADCYSAAALGDEAFLSMQDMVTAYASLSRNGNYIPSVMTNKISLNGTVKSAWSAPKGEQAIKADAAYIVSDILSDPNASFLPETFKQSFTASGFKVSLMTGITNDNASANAFGYTTQYVAGFWYGTDAGDTALKGTGETNTLPVISGWLTDAGTGKTVTERTKPDKLQTLPAQVITTAALGAVVPSAPTDLYPSYYK